MLPLKKNVKTRGQLKASSAAWFFIVFFLSSTEGFSDFHIGKMEGIIIVENEKGFDHKITAGYALIENDLLKIDYDSRGLLLHEDEGKIFLSPKTKIQWLKSEGGRDLFNFEKGGLKIDYQDHSGNPTRVKLPYGQVEQKKALLYVALHRDRSAEVEVDRGQVICQHKNKRIKPVKLNSGDAARIDREGIHVKKKDEPSSQKMRAHFEFRNKNLDVVAASPKDQNNNSPEGEAKVKSLGSTSTSDSARGEATDAKITEGQGSGKGEFSYVKSSIFLIILLIASGVGGGIWWLKNKKQKNSEDEQVTGNKKIREEDAYDTEDIYVWRDNLTSHDGILKTEKVTHILGNVEDGAIIEAEHKLVIKGSFQSARLHASDNVTVQGGINGQGKGILEITGDLNTSYINEATIRVGGHVEAHQGIRNSSVSANGNIDVLKKTIMGGTVACNKTLTCYSLGSDFCKTNIILGKSADAVWSDDFKQKLEQPFEPVDNNPRSTLKVIDELSSTTIVLNNLKLDQKKLVPGPIKTVIDPAQPDKLQLRGFRKDEP